jgi:hypothetical protein
MNSLMNAFTTTNNLNNPNGINAKNAGNVIDARVAPTMRLNKSGLTHKGHSISNDENF